MQKSSPENPGSLSAYTRGLLAKYNFPPKKKLGQNFIIDKASVDRIVLALRLSEDDCVLEIGTGLGTLTKELARIAKRVFSVEYDKLLFEIVKEVLKEQKNIELIREDFLRLDVKKLLKKCGHYKIAGNLPYYITSPIIEKLVEVRPRFELAALTMQKEVADRIAARAGTKEYGSLSIYVQYHFAVEIKSLIPNSAFFPHPSISSALITLTPRENPPVSVLNEQIFFDIVHAAFGHRRKILRNAILLSRKLSATEEDLDRAFLKAEISGVRRGETLSLDEFAKLANALS